MKRPHHKPDYGQLGPAMRALPNDRWRAFVYHLVTGKQGHGALTAAAHAAGFGRRSTPVTLAKLAWKLSDDDRMIAAIAEESRRIIRAGAPAAANALLSLIYDPGHKDHGRAIALALERFDPAATLSHHSADVVHKIVDPDVEALEELRALRQLGTPREKLLELFGTNGLDRIERLEASDQARPAATAKVIEGVETVPAGPPVEEMVPDGR
jgi:hypothetical protein